MSEEAKNAVHAFRRDDRVGVARAHRLFAHAWRGPLVDHLDARESLDVQLAVDTLLPCAREARQALTPVFATLARNQRRFSQTGTWELASASGVAAVLLTELREALYAEATRALWLEADPTTALPLVTRTQLETLAQTTLEALATAVASHTEATDRDLCMGLLVARDAALTSLWGEVPRTSTRRDRAFAAVYAALVRSCAVAKVAPKEAEDLCSQLMLRLLDGLALQFDGVPDLRSAGVRAWLNRLTSHRNLDEVDRRQRSGADSRRALRLDSEVWSTGIDPEEGIDAAFLCSVVGLHRLPDRDEPPPPKATEEQVRDRIWLDRAAHDLTAAQLLVKWRPFLAEATPVPPIRTTAVAATELAAWNKVRRLPRAVSAALERLVATGPRSTKAAAGWAALATALVQHGTAGVPDGPEQQALARACEDLDLRLCGDPLAEQGLGPACRAWFDAWMAWLRFYDAFQAMLTRHRALLATRVRHRHGVAIGATVDRLKQGSAFERLAARYASLATALGGRAEAGRGTEGDVRVTRREVDEAILCGNIKRLRTFDTGSLQRWLDAVALPYHLERWATRRQTSADAALANAVAAGVSRLLEEDGAEPRPLAGAVGGSEGARAARLHRRAEDAVATTLSLLPGAVTDPHTVAARIVEGQPHLCQLLAAAVVNWSLAPEFGFQRPNEPGRSRTPTAGHAQLPAEVTATLLGHAVDGLAQTESLAASTRETCLRAAKAHALGELHAALTRGPLAHLQEELPSEVRRWSD